MFLFFRVLFIGLFVSTIFLNASDIKGFRHSSSSAAASTSYVQGAVYAKVENGKIIFINDRYEAISAYIHNNSGNIVGKYIIPPSTSSGFNAASSMIKDLFPNLIAHGNLNTLTDYFSQGSAMEIESSIPLSSFPEGGTISYVSGTQEAIIGASIAMALKSAVTLTSLLSASDISPVTLQKIFKQVFETAITDVNLLATVTTRLQNIPNSTAKAELLLIGKDTLNWFQDNAYPIILAEIITEAYGLDSTDLAKSFNLGIGTIENMSDVLTVASSLNSILIAQQFGPTVQWYDMSYGSDDYLKAIYKMNWLNAETSLKQHDEVTFLATKNIYDSSFTWWNPATWNDPFQAEYERYEFRHISAINTKTTTQIAIEQSKILSMQPTQYQPKDDQGNDLSSTLYVAAASSTTSYNTTTKKFTAKAGDALTISFKDFDVCATPSVTKASQMKFQLVYADGDYGVDAPFTAGKYEMGFSVPKDGDFVIKNVGYYDETKNNRLTTCGTTEKIAFDPASGSGATTGDTTASLPVLHTGQTISYAVGDDAYYHAGKARSYTRDNTNNIVTDNVTKLMWQDDAETKSITKNWADAQTYCSNLTLGVYSDWMLPDVKELQSIVNLGENFPALDTFFEHDAAENYWSSTTLLDYEDLAWIVNTGDGGGGSGMDYDDKSNGGHVRCVRGDKIPPPSFDRDAIQEIVTDITTGLIWQDNMDAKTITKNWNNAIGYCDNLSLAGYTDWRLPNKNELSYITDYSHIDSSLNVAFINVPSDNYRYFGSYYWSSTSYAGGTGNAWLVDAYRGTMSNFYGKSNNYYVRCVRGGQFDPLPVPLTPKTRLIFESPQDYAIKTATFTKTWKFSLANGSVSDLHVNILSNNGFSSYATPSLIDEGSGRFRIEMSVTPNHANPINKLTLQLKDKNDNIVKVSGSETFWAVIRTNNPPQFNASQITHIASESGTLMRIKLLGEDIDDDPISYALVSNGGGVVSIQNDEVQATFNDGSVCHEVKVALSDDKESITKSLSFLTFTPENLKTFYEDVNDQNSAWQEIYFATLKGVAIGEEGNTTCKRKFRPYDDVTWAEALKMISLSVAKANDLKLPKASFAVEGPSWVRPYYTFAKLRGALDDNVSMYDPVTREQMGSLVSKLLKLESFDEFNLTKIDFGDKALFSSEEAHQSALLTKLFGLYMTGSNALPNTTVKRDEVAEITANILRMPKGEFDIPTSIEYGDTLTLKGIKNLRATAILTLGDQTIKEEWISSPKEYVTLDVASGQTLLGSNLSLKTFSPMNIPTPPTTLTIIGMLHNNDGNVKNLIKTVVDINYTDTDGDGVQDKNDKWANDARYSVDTNNNGIPDIIDSLYNTADKNATSTTQINNQTASIAQIIQDGGIDIAKYYPEIAMRLEQGWSLRGLGADANVTEAKWNTLFGSAKIVWKYKDSTWRAYSSFDTIKGAINAKSITSFDTISAGEGFWIQSNTNQIVAMDVNETTYQLSIPATKGWHLKATPKTTAITSFTANRADITYIWTYRNGKWTLWAKDGLQGGFDSLDTINPHEGFWILIK